jgi:hypothetical protein
MLGRTCLTLALLVATLALAPAAHAQPSETAVKAAFLPRFARYVTWPATATPKADAPFALCVIGEDRFRSLLDRAARTQSIDGRKIIIRRLKDAAGVTGCHVAFVQGSRTHSVQEILTAIGRQPVLTVTDAANAPKRGVIHFVLVGGRVRFIIDEGAAQRRGLDISSRLLALAVGVQQ